MARRFLSAIKLLTGSTPPAGTAGDTFFDTDSKTIQVHDGNAWVNSAVQATDGAAGGRVFTGDVTPTAPVAGDLWVDSSGFSAGANILRWREIAVGGETSLSGLDDLGTTLSYTPGYELVHINGVLQVRGQDYVATTGTTITGLAALAAGDVVDIIAHSNMVYGDCYTQSQADARYYTQAQSDANYVNKNVGGLNLVVPTGATGGTVGANGAVTVGSAVSSVTVTGAFSSAYENYKIIYSGGVLVGGQGQLSLQLGSSIASYRGNLMYQQYGSNAVNGASDNGSTSFTWVGGGNTNGCWLTCDLLGPNLARFTRIKDGLYAVTDTTGIYSGLHEVATAYTDFTMIVGSGQTATGGTIRIYGYNNGA